MTQVSQQPAPAAQPNGQVAKVELSPSERFTASIEREFAATTSKGVQLTQFQKKLCMNYFLKIDSVLKAAEVKRLAKSEKYREPTAYVWQNVNMNALAIDVIAFSAVGMDPTQPNHLNPIPFQNKNTGKLDIAFIPGYKGTEIKARKYGLDVPDNVVVEVVFSNDKFRAIKKDSKNKVESYEFEIVEPFNRGEVVGGFYCHEFAGAPEKNKLRVFSKADIDKRKPDHASVEFWGGTKEEWKNGQKTGNAIEVEGWYEEMAYKTIYKAAYNAITIDSQKIDEHYMAVIQREQDNRDNVILKEIASNANKSEIGFDEPVQDVTVVDEPKVESKNESSVSEQATEANEIKTRANGQQLEAPFA